MARRKITNSQAICIIVLWIILCYMLLAYSKQLDFMVWFAIISSAIIVFVPLYKNLRKK